MAITPADIEQKTFSEAKKHGYDTEEVDEFLDQLSAEVDAMLKKIKDLKDRLTASEQQVAASQAQIAQLKEQQAAPAPVAQSTAPQQPASSVSESQISRVLILAQQSADQLMEDARSNAESIRTEADRKAREVIRQALAEKQNELDEIDRLSSPARTSAPSTRSSCSTSWTTPMPSSRAGADHPLRLCRRLRHPRAEARAQRDGLRARPGDGHDRRLRRLRRPRLGRPAHNACLRRPRTGPPLARERRGLLPSSRVRDGLAPQGPRTRPITAFPGTPEGRCRPRPGSALGPGDPSRLRGPARRGPARGAAASSRCAGHSRAGYGRARAPWSRDRSAATWRARRPRHRPGRSDGRGRGLSRRPSAPPGSPCAPGRGTRPPGASGPPGRSAPSPSVPRSGRR